MAKFAILLSRDVTPTPRLRDQLRGARVIAADSGMKHAEALDLQPELWVGDFDSSSASLQQRWSQVEQLRFPAAKDKTDGELAIASALQRGAREVILVGALGGQLDHVLSHATQVLAKAAVGLKLFATTGEEELWPLSKALTLPNLPRGTRFSIVGFTDLESLSVIGARWPLAKRDVPLGSALTLSNESEGDVAITLGSGSAVVLLYPKAKF